MVDMITEQVGQQIGASKGEGTLRVADVTTASLEALDYYQKGCGQFFRWNYLKARELLRQAIELDPAFAMAYAWLAMAEVGGPGSLSDLYSDLTEPKKPWNRLKNTRTGPRITKV